MEVFLAKPEGFDWDELNKQKSLLKHGVGPFETEETFFNFNLINPDLSHSQKEPRFRMLGQAKNSSILFIVFTIRNNKIRVISSRLANKKERGIYAKAAKENS